MTRGDLLDADQLSGRLTPSTTTRLALPSEIDKEPSGLTLPVRRDELSTTLQNLRSSAGLNQTEAGRRAGTSQATISRFETGAQMPTEAEIERLCDIYRAPTRTR